MAWFHPIDKNLLFTKNDKEDPRLGECVQLLPKVNLEDLDQHPSDIVIVGYPDDDGISLNGGRPGAQVAPREIRRALYKMTPHLQAKRLPKILDLGEMINRIHPLAERHETGKNTIALLNKKKRRWISLGGGHDYGFADTAGFVEAHAGNAVVLNFDAHMDVRPIDKGLNSGTPFFRALTDYAGKFAFAEIGIQNQCNSVAHVRWAQEKGAEVFTLDEVEEKGLLNCVKTFMQAHAGKKVFISLDIDAFNSSEAPGCSQSWATGLRAKEFLPCLDWLVANHDVQGMGIYEVSPPLDPDNRTAKLAALIAHRFIFDILKKEN